MITVKEVMDCGLKGLFQRTDYKVGLIFPVMIKDEKPKFIWGGIPITNNENGENKARELMKQSDFVCWAKDPWTGKENLKAEYFQ